MKEVRLPDDYQVYADYSYVVDGIVTKPGITGTVRDIKARTGAKEICLCDEVARGIRKAVRHG